MKHKVIFHIEIRKEILALNQFLNLVVQKPVQEGQQPNIPPRKSREKSRDSLLKVSFENGINGAGGFLGNNKYVTPYKHDPTVMNADLPLPPVTFRRPNSSSPQWVEIFSE